MNKKWGNNVFYSHDMKLQQVMIIITRIIKSIVTQMKEDVGILKPKKHANKVGRLIYDPKLNKVLSYNLT